jgi:hypothetical protein
MDWYKRVRFACPTCHAPLVVERGQVRRREAVTCTRCNTDLLLLPRSSPLAAEQERRDGLRHAPRDAVAVALDV